MLALLGNGIARLFRNAPLNRIGQAHTPTQPGRLRRPDQAYRDDIGVVVSETEQQKLVRGLHLRDLAGGEELRVRPVVGYLQKYALQPMLSTFTSYAAPSPELYIPQMKSGSLSPRRLSQPSKPGTVADSGVSGCVEYLNNVQSACGRLCQGHHTVIPAMTADTTADPVEIHADQSIIALAS